MQMSTTILSIDELNLFEQRANRWKVWIFSPQEMYPDTQIVFALV